MADPTSVEEWLALAKQHEIAAKRLLTARQTTTQAVFHAGVAMECAIKAKIIREQRFNAWPTKSARPDLYTHDLSKLIVFANIQLDPRSATASAWHVALQWDRNQGYDQPMPMRVARSMLEAAFGTQGILPWIRQSLT